MDGRLPRSGVQERARLGQVERLAGGRVVWGRTVALWRCVRRYRPAERHGWTGRRAEIAGEVREGIGGP
ncbi:MAG: hypothetical protein O9248_00915 [Rhodobacteraceae bacterium]|nr:hypothetical protein [Paracoccaceae bacterium]